MLRQTLTAQQGLNIIPFILTYSASNVTCDVDPSVLTAAYTATGRYTITPKNEGYNAYQYGIGNTSLASGVVVEATPTGGTAAEMRTYTNAGALADGNMYGVLIQSSAGKPESTSMPMDFVGTPYPSVRMLVFYVNESGVLVHGKNDATMTGSSGDYTFTLKNPGVMTVVPIASAVSAARTASTVTVVSATNSKFNLKCYNHAGSAAAGGMMVFAFCRDNRMSGLKNGRRPIMSTQIGTMLNFVSKGSGSTTYDFGANQFTNTSGGTGLPRFTFGKNAYTFPSVTSTRNPVSVGGAFQVTNDAKVMPLISGSDYTKAYFQTVDSSGALADYGMNALIACFRSNSVM